MCRKDDYPGDRFNEVSTTVSDNLINALSNLTENQESIERRLQSVDERLKSNESNNQAQATSNYKSYQSQTTQQQQFYQQQSNSYLNYRNFAPQRARFPTQISIRGNYNSNRYGHQNPRNFQIRWRKPPTVPIVTTPTTARTTANIHK